MVNDLRAIKRHILVQPCTPTSTLLIVISEEHEAPDQDNLMRPTNTRLESHYRNFVSFPFEPCPPSLAAITTKLELPHTQKISRDKTRNFSSLLTKSLSIKIKIKKILND